MDTQENPLTPPTPPTAVERATVGCRVWFWSGSNDGLMLNVKDKSQPMDAGVIYVHPSGRVNLSVTDHLGGCMAVDEVELMNPSSGLPDAHESNEECYATWMPFQVRKQGGSS